MSILSSHLDQLQGSEEKDILKMDILSVLADSIVMTSQQLSQIFMHAHKTKSLNITLKDRDRGMGC